MLSKAKEGEPLGWWPAKIVLERADLGNFVIGYAGFDYSYNEIVERRRLRPVTVRLVIYNLTRKLGLVVISPSLQEPVGETFLTDSCSPHHTSLRLVQQYSKSTKTCYGIVKSSGIKRSFT